MSARLHGDRRASTALEFALIAPVMLATFMGSFALCVGMWTLTVLQDTAEQAARCAAISSAACVAVTSGCDSGSPVVCYVEHVATGLGVASVTASEVTVSTATVGGAPFTAVAIAHSFKMMGWQLTLSASGMFPTNVTTWSS